MTVCQFSNYGKTLRISSVPLRLEQSTFTLSLAIDIKILKGLNENTQKSSLSQKYPSQSH